MSVYSISCSIYSFNIQSLNNYFGLFFITFLLPSRLLLLFAFSQGIKRVYIGSQLIYASGMLLMGFLRHRFAVIILSAVAGVLYSTLFTIPYLLISKYYTSNTVCKHLPFEFHLLTSMFIVWTSTFQWTNTRYWY